jgi:hypothetical protein
LLFYVSFFLRTKKYIQTFGASEKGFRNIEDPQKYCTGLQGGGFLSEVGRNEMGGYTRSFSCVCNIYSLFLFGNWGLNSGLGAC